MEETKKFEEHAEREIVYSKTIKAGKRIYYVDVKRNKKGELYLAITESKKIVTGADVDNLSVSFEKHKIFLYKEDFGKFQEALKDTVDYIEGEQGKAEPRQESEGGINIDMEF